MKPYIMIWTDNKEVIGLEQEIGTQSYLVEDDGNRFVIESWPPNPQQMSSVAFDTWTMA